LILRLDLGNSRLKWVEGADGKVCTAFYSQLPKFSAEKYSSIHVSSVRTDEDTLRVLSLIGLEAHPSVLQAVVRHPDFPCFYNDPTSLGIDRFLAALGASQMNAKCIVVDAGTALTIDLVDNGFRGGVIALGMARSISELLKNTDRVNEGEGACPGRLPQKP